MSGIFRTALIGMVIMPALIGCASFEEHPYQDYKNRAKSQIDGDVKIWSSVLSDDESRDGRPETRKGRLLSHLAPQRCRGWGVWFTTVRQTLSPILDDTVYRGTEERDRLETI